jgi:anaerobic magnesium-protoporphyrin IX monomethyl ester cyclase
MKVLLVRGPRYYWPYINEYDNFLLPQSLPCLAAILRDNDIDVIPLDCMPLKMGWHSLRKFMERGKADVVGVGDSETLYSHEAIKVLQLAKEVDKETITIAGGHHFSNLVEETMRDPQIDFIVRWEGEYTLLELVQELMKPAQEQDFKKIKGIAFRSGDSKIICTPPRPLIENLDELPLPAYDLMPMDRYGKSRYLFSPQGTTIHHSRGCTGSCLFCACWVQMAEHEIRDGKFTSRPKWRTKSVERTIEEMELLHHKYKKRYLVFTDDTWNVSPKWNEEFANALLERDLDLHWFAFMRADFILRDERIGIFKKLVDAGLVHVGIGVERAFDDELQLLGKTGYSREKTKECFNMLREKYPHVFKQATFVVGLRNETRETLLEQLKFAIEIGADYPGFHPITPVPGTPIWGTAKEKKWIEVDDFGRYDWMTPIISSEYLSREEIGKLVISMNRKFIRPEWLLRGLFSSNKFKRDMYIWWLLVSLRIAWGSIKERINPLKKEPEGGNEYIFKRFVKPKWYDG